MPSPTRRIPLLLCSLLALSLPAWAADPPSTCKYLEAARVDLQYTGPGLEITMPGTINGKPARMLADTGSGRTYLTMSAVRRHKLHLRETVERVQGIGGESKVYAVKVSDFSAGPARSTAATMRVPGDTGFVPNFDAIVGAPYLLQTDLELSLATKQARFFRPVDCDRAWLAYWDRNANVIPFALNGETGNPIFHVYLNGHKLEAMIDSGASTTSVDLNAARRAGIDVDAPGSVRRGNASGVGSRTVANWHVTASSLAIGDETIRNPELSVIGTGGRLSVDVLLGADFLRSHRVLFAMSQRKIYISYTGGAPLSQRRGIEPWMQQEADAGNPDAQFALARHYLLGRGAPSDPAAAERWLGKAAAQGQPHANLLLGRRHLLGGQVPEARARLRSALDGLPLDRRGALWLYLAELRGGDAALARQELDERLRGSGDGWPVPVADYLRGKIDGPALLALASTPAQACEAASFMALHTTTPAAPTPGCPGAAQAEALFMNELR